MEPLKIFVGYDPVESVAWHTLVHSIYSQSSVPVSFTPINIRNLNNVFQRARDSKQSNEFSFTRFLVPYLCAFEGFALFMDCDMLLRTDIKKVFDLAKADQKKAVHVVQHTYEPRDDVKYLNTVQYSYPRKNWSSFVLWNCAHPKNKALTTEYVNSASGLELHRFLWLDDEDIGDLDLKWNWLVGEYDQPPKDVNTVHWTNGGPYFHEYKNTDFSSEWFEQNKNMNFCKQRS